MKVMRITRAQRWAICLIGVAAVAAVVAGVAVSSLGRGAEGARHELPQALLDTVDTRTLVLVGHSETTDFFTATLAHRPPGTDGPAVQLTCFIAAGEQSAGLGCRQPLNVAKRGHYMILDTTDGVEVAGVMPPGLRAVSWRGMPIDVDGTGFFAVEAVRGEGDIEISGTGGRVTIPLGTEDLGRATREARSPR